ncbi:hypothetical protein [Paracraurococcus ruber]|uniref:Lipoprotein n=1 Tax=Paracraurococcus ruber TaxID=77675 RepID=A0ABS1CV91_9PROT|nr:hypothetical protein [Paracraurococcus ruber]MBK1657952.1 hypothetical protein [Paracraurococcus ruber]TDG31636.1 hypothetical protein E2C05_10160 [Paracraurococcus ruber]
MHRRALFALLVLPACGTAQPIRQDPPAAASPAERQQQLDGFWQRQREKEAADRFWNGPREARRNLTRDQIERWEDQRWRRQGWRSYPY